MLMNTRLTPSVDEAPCCPLWHRRNPTGPLLPLPSLENVAHLPHSSSSTSSPVALHYFIIAIKVTKEKAITKSRAWIHIVGWASQNPGKRLVKQEEQTPKFLSSFLPYPNHLPKGVMDGCKLAVCLKTSFNTKVHQCYLLKHKQRRLYSLSIQEQLNHKSKIFRFIMPLPFCAYKSLKRWEVENRYIGRL